MEREGRLPSPCILPLTLNWHYHHTCLASMNPSAWLLIRTLILTLSSPVVKNIIDDTIPMIDWCGGGGMIVCSDNLGRAQPRPVDGSYCSFTSVFREAFLVGVDDGVPTYHGSYWLSWSVFLDLRCTNFHSIASLRWSIFASSTAGRTSRLQLSNPLFDRVDWQKSSNEADYTPNR